MVSARAGITLRSLWRYHAFTRLSLREHLAYREQVFFVLFNLALRITTQLFFWSVVFRQRSTIAGFDRSAMFTYIFITAALTFLFSGLFHRKMVQSIVDGSIAMDLIKPADLYTSYLFAFVGQVIFNLLTYIPVIVLAGIVIFHVHGPRMALAWPLFVVSLLLGVLLWHSIRWLFTMVVFWTESGRGLGLLASYIVQFLSGSLVPLTFFPPSIARIFYWFPFQSVIYTPAGIFTSAIDVAQGARLIGLELLWVVVLYAVSQVCWRGALRNLTTQGG